MLAILQQLGKGKIKGKLLKDSQSMLLDALG
jgi:hypothetical protein